MCLCGSLMQGAIDTYQQALREKPSTDLFDSYISFLTQHLEEHLQSAPQEAADTEADGQAPQPSPIDAAAAAGRLLAAFEQAAEAGESRMRGGLSSRRGVISHRQRMQEIVAYTITKCDATELQGNQ